MSLDDVREAGFDIDAKNHALAILTTDFPAPLEELCDTLLSFRISCTELIRSGGGEASSTQRLRRALAEREWVKRKVVVKKVVDGQEKASVTHEIDHVRDDANGALALEIEWNNKDPFFDRDLENFKRLHAEGAISAGIVVTRGASMQSSMREIILGCAKARGITGYRELSDLGLSLTPRQIGNIERRMDGDFVDAWSRVFVSDKFGTATTHWVKLKERVNRGVGNPCPLLLLGIPASAVTITDPD